MKGSKKLRLKNFNITNRHLSFTLIGDGLHWGVTERTEALKTQLQAKEETIKALKEQVVSMEQEKYKRNREIDILRQSLRIMTSKKEQQIETFHKCVCK